MAKRVLVVDDHTETVKLIDEAFSKAGFRVRTACNGAECLLELEASVPDLVIMDVGMPVLDGLDTLRLLRQNPDTADTPVIILSGKGGYDDVRAGWRTGAEMYLTKPVRIGALLAAARHLLGLSPDRLPMQMAVVGRER
jgi:DNA-binding response OmpR family regulator